MTTSCLNEENVEYFSVDLDDNQCLFLTAEFSLNVKCLSHFKGPTPDFFFLTYM